MRRALWIFGGIVVVFCILGMVLAPKKQADDLDAFRSYAALDSTNYYRAADINKQFSASLRGAVATHSMAMRFMEVRNIRKGELFRLLDGIKAAHGWQRTGKARWWLLQSVTGSPLENNLVVEQLSVICPGNKDLEHMPDDARINCEINETRYLTKRDEIRLRIQNYGKDPFSKF